MMCQVGEEKCRLQEVSLFLKNPYGGIQNDYACMPHCEWCREQQP